MTLQRTNIPGMTNKASPIFTEKLPGPERLLMRCGRAMAYERARRNCRFIGVISDTHGLIRPEAVTALKGSDLLIHAGDVGKPEVLAALQSIGPVIAVRGNNDKGRWARGLRETVAIKAGRVLIYVLHDLKTLATDPKSRGFRLVISGHSHRPSLVEREGVLYLNPGSAGPRRFKLPVCIARLEIQGAAVAAKVVELKV